MRGRERQSPDSTYDSRCRTCEVVFLTPASARRHAREQRHHVVIVEQLRADGRAS